MADSPISGLTAATTLADTDEFVINASSTSKKIDWSDVYKQIPRTLTVAVSDETTVLSTGTAKVTFRAPHAMVLTDIRGSLTTAGTGAALLTVDINESGTTILSTKMTFDASEKTTTTAATPLVISDANIADDAEITIDIDTIDTDNVAAGLKVTFYYSET